MELSIIRLQDPPPDGLAGERRRRIRHKPHTPAFATFSSPGMVLDLSELLDLNEDGFAVRTSEPMQVNQAVNLSLDLTETKAFIHCAGQVVWSDRAGRGGVKFAGLPDQSRRQLKDWLFINLMIACSHQAFRSRQRAVAERPLEPLPAESRTLPVADLTGMLSAVDAVRREVHSVGHEIDVVLNLITERALSLTGASGAALALLTDDRMICRARSGEPAPALGSPVDARRGFSGECLRTGRTVLSEDTETDHRVDREACRALGIGSILATPIFSDFRVVGLIEVFSPQPRAFSEVYQTALERLAEIVPKVQQGTKPASSPADHSAPEVKAAENLSGGSTPDVRDALWESEREQEPLRGFSIRRIHLALIVLTAAIAAMVLGYVLAPAIERVWQRNTRSAVMESVVQAATPPVTSPPAKPKTLADLRTLAESGNADAQWSMAQRYHSGDGVPHDDAQAVQWFQRAAEQGHLDSQSSLGAYYFAGRGVPKDFSKAYFWSIIALARGDNTVKPRLDFLTSRMTRAEVSASHLEADDWLRQHNARVAAK